MEDGNKSRGRGLIGQSFLEEGEEKTGEILRTVELLFESDAVVELRAFKGRETISGYFDDHVLLAREARKLEDRDYSVYVTLNEVDPALLARASNRARKVYKEPTTSDSDILPAVAPPGLRSSKTVGGICDRRGEEGCSPAGYGRSRVPARARLA
jgi:hypothetical protein